jgi:hypothetical protein
MSVTCQGWKSCRLCRRHSAAACAPSSTSAARRSCRASSCCLHAAQQPSSSGGEAGIARPSTGLPAVLAQASQLCGGGTVPGMAPSSHLSWKKPSHLSPSARRSEALVALASGLPSAAGPLSGGWAPAGSAAKRSLRRRRRRRLGCCISTVPCWDALHLHQSNKQERGTANAV